MESRIQPSEIVMIQTTKKKRMQSSQLHEKEQNRMEPTTHIFLTVDPGHLKVKEEEEKVTVKMELVETSKAIQKLESVSGLVKTEVDPSDDEALSAIKVEEIDVKEEVEKNGSKYKEFFNCSDFEVKEELVDFNNGEQEEKPRDVDDKEDDEEASSDDDDEQVDARLLYPRHAAGEISEEDEDKEVEGKFEEAVVKSIEIMEASCFGQMEDKVWEDGKDKRLNCEKCNRQFSSRRWLAR